LSAFTPAVVDLILAGVAFEAILLLAYRRRTGRGVAALPLLANLAAGASLMLALRMSMSDGPASAWIPACLSVALVAHLIDLTSRWERLRGSPTSR
jgi:hypothetical protein